MIDPKKAKKAAAKKTAAPKKAAAAKEPKAPKEKKKLSGDDLIDAHNESALEAFKTSGAKGKMLVEENDVLKYITPHNN